MQHLLLDAPYSEALDAKFKGVEPLERTGRGGEGDNDRQGHRTWVSLGEATLDACQELLAEFAAKLSKLTHEADPNNAARVTMLLEGTTARVIAFKASSQQIKINGGATGVTAQWMIYRAAKAPGKANRSCAEAGPHQFSPKLPSAADDETAPLLLTCQDAHVSYVLDRDAVLVYQGLLSTEPDYLIPGRATLEAEQQLVFLWRSSQRTPLLLEGVQPELWSKLLPYLTAANVTVMGGPALSLQQCINMATCVHSIAAASENHFASLGGYVSLECRLRTLFMKGRIQLPSDSGSDHSSKAAAEEDGDDDDDEGTESRFKEIPEDHMLAGPDPNSYYGVAACTGPGMSDFQYCLASRLSCFYCVDEESGIPFCRQYLFALGCGFVTTTVGEDEEEERQRA